MLVAIQVSTKHTQIEPLHTIPSITSSRTARNAFHAVPCFVWSSKNYNTTSYLYKQLRYHSFKIHIPSKLVTLVARYSFMLMEEYKKILVVTHSTLFHANGAVSIEWYAAFPKSNAVKRCEYLKVC